MKHNIAFVIEQTLGHVTHTQNVRAAVEKDGDVAAYWILPTWEAKMPPLLGDNWTVRTGWQARRGLARLANEVALDALFFHTQVPAVLNAGWLARHPSVVSLDATPLQYDRLGDFYDHETGPRRLEQLKWNLNHRVFERARALVTWSAWARQGLATEYGIDPERVTVIPPGVPVAAWAPPDGPRQVDPEAPVRILFVGGDLARKGGHDLLAAFQILHGAGLPVELHLVTRDEVIPAPGVTVHHGLQPNSDALRRLYWESDIFCLPTYGDALPLALAEAAAAGLPLVATSVAAIPEIVEDNRTGQLVPPGQPEALAAALRKLVSEPGLRQWQGQRAQQRARERFDAATNSTALLALLKEVAAEGRSKRGVSGLAAKSGQDARAPQGARVLLTVSGVVPDDVSEQVRRGERPLPDYVAMAAEFGAHILDYQLAEKSGGWLGRLLGRVAGRNALLAWTVFRLRRHYDVLFSDGEQVGIPLALLLKLAHPRGPRPRHLMIAHILSTPQKMPFFDYLRLQSHIDTIFTYATWQQRFIGERWGLPEERVVFTPFMVDAAFFSPERAGETPLRLPPGVAESAQPLICAVGLEFRDYPTLLEAVRGLPVQVVIAAASPWSQRADTTAGREIPPNVHVDRFSQAELRALYGCAAFVVMPLFDVEFQAGVTAILEAMAMEKAVICSRTPGQTDVIVEGETGLYVEPEAPDALRGAIAFLLERPELARQMGEAGRRRILAEMDLDHYVQRLKAYV
jgi:glycosyltransferase involved in cell wall biosynthesis